MWGSSYWVFSSSALHRNENDQIFVAFSLCEYVVAGEAHSDGQSLCYEERSRGYLLLQAGASPMLGIGEKSSIRW
jgi:hypothetical protein